MQNYKSEIITGKVFNVKANIALKASDFIIHAYFKMYIRAILLSQQFDTKDLPLFEQARQFAVKLPLVGGFAPIPHTYRHTEKR